VGSLNQRLALSIARLTGRSISTRLSFKTSSNALARAIRAAKACQFSQAYVITHEIGHHVQNLLGLLPKVQEAQSTMEKAEANNLQVRVELQADCLAGVWANHSQKTWQFIEPGDVESAIKTASAMATTGCSGERGATWCPTRLLTEPQSNAAAGS
jgi:hypothetical protein